MQQSQTKRKKILQAALETFAEQGLHNSPTSQIATVAGVGEGSIYRYFESKDQIITVLHEEIFRQLASAANQEVDMNKPVRDSILGILQRVINYLLHHPQEFRFIEQFHFSPYGSGKRRAPVKRYDQPFFDLLKLGIEQKQIKAMPLEILFGLCFGPLVYFVRSHLATNSALETCRIEEISIYSWDSIKME